jgi:hypothetical protein
MVCWCETFFRDFLSRLLVLVLAKEGSPFFVAAACAAAVGFLLGRFFAEVLVITVNVRSWWQSSYARTFGMKICDDLFLITVRRFR